MQRWLGNTLISKNVNPSSCFHWIMWCLWLSALMKCRYCCHQLEVLSGTCVWTFTVWNLDCLHNVDNKMKSIEVQYWNLKQNMEYWRRVGRVALMRWETSGVKDQVLLLLLFYSWSPQPASACRFSKQVWLMLLTTSQPVRLYLECNNACTDKDAFNTVTIICKTTYFLSTVINLCAGTVHFIWRILHVMII